jgi:ketosteroid isomerase-like protein
MLRAMHEHVRGAEPVERLAELIHPDAEMRLLVSFGAVLHGREAVFDALERGREATVYQARVHAFEWLDDQTVLSFARARYALQGGGHAESNVCWLDQLRDGLIWRVQAFTNEHEARRAYADRRETPEGT